MGLITPSSASSGAGAGTSLPPPPPAPLAGALTQDQLDAQNKARGISQYNTGSALVGGPVGSQTTTPPNPGTAGLFPSVLSSLAYGTPDRNAQLAQKAQGIADTAGQQIADIGKAGAQAQGGYLTTGTTPVAEGNAAVIKQTTAAEQQAVAQGANMALTGNQQGLTASGQTANALGSAGGLVPEALRYGGLGGGNLDPNTAIGNLAQAVANGGTTGLDYNTAYSQLSSAYGPVIANQLLAAVQKINPSFNVSLSNASPGTQSVGQQASAAAPAAYQALDALQTAYNNLPDLAKGNVGGANVPWLQGLTQVIGANTGVSRPQISAFQGALAEARAQIDAVLSPIIGVNAAALQASALLPDNMAPTELPQKVQAAKTYVQQRIESYTASGQQPAPISANGSRGGAGGLYNW